MVKGSRHLRFREGEYVELRHRRSWILLVGALVFCFDVAHVLLLVFFWNRQPLHSDSSTNATIIVAVLTSFSLVVLISLWRTPFGFFSKKENSITLIHPLTKRGKCFPSNLHVGRLVAEGSKIAFIGPTGYRQVLVNQVFVQDDGFIATHNAILDAK
jgi:uncharacterized membrane protein (DUF485 family)